MLHYISWKKYGKKQNRMDDLGPPNVNQDDFPKESVYPMGWKIIELWLEDVPLFVAGPRCSLADQ